MRTLRHLAHTFYRNIRPSLLNSMILKLAVPVVFGMFSQTVVWVTDTMMVGRLGKNSIASIGIGGIAHFTVLAFLMGFAMGIQVIVARRFGEKNDSEIGKIGITTLYIVAVFGGLLSIGGAAISDRLMNFLNKDEIVKELSSQYLYFRFLGTVFFFLLFTTRAFTDGLGITTAGLASMIITCFANIFLNWVLIYGNLGFEAMGVKGAAIASSLAGAAGLFAFPFYFYSRGLGKYFSHISWAFSFTHFREILKASTSPALAELLNNISFMIFTEFATVVGTTALAVTNMLFSTLSLSFLPGYAFGIAATTILGQALGAGKPKLAYHGAFRSAFFAACVMGSMGLVFIIWGKKMLSFYTTDSELIENAYSPLVILGMIQIVDAYHMVIACALRGAGLQNFVFRAYTAASYLVFLPCAYFLGIHLKMGSAGLWSGIVPWVLVLASVFIVRFRRKDWAQNQV
ncbi:MATE family efflux transporter [Leptospira santarosai]|uniref:Multidrug-efflux transporter n=1 Tax=Leptospira santarosai serovar Shermani str. LT 821 TaxID=758847 RepID=K8Y6L3_9LEPT|nr:MATE family efflux transporter [Leptospira santarosai]EKT86292.1 multidrug transporter MatE [Leptospira santarosai serovar Shermani str. LT 821]EMM86144.1 MATE efflux family protein [Leptospira santarosai str. 2000027870]EPG83454.1 MATE efflux family protein [Leptospira santarosai serovar Shermani str. 1342KT]KXZ25346.1 MATE family efflux transporter [Leptospira santarosai]